jgi:GT2 family glycosyltransferase/glycosyltransferase involved in cell wall biosynthesis
MPLRTVNIGENLGLRRCDAVVCVPVYGAEELFAECLASVLAHTDPTVPVLVCDDATRSERIRPIVEESLAAGSGPHTVYYLRQPQNVGFVANVNAAMDTSAPADIVLLNSDCVVSEGWFRRLRDAAYSESRVATATAVTNAGTIVSTPDRNKPMLRLPEGANIELMAAAVRSESLRLYPDLPTCVGHCVYLRRSAIELVGEFDLEFSPGYEEEVDFSQRCVLHGLRHVLADDVFVFHHQGGSFGRDEAPTRRQDAHHAIIARRYSYYDAWVREVADDERSPLARSLLISSVALRGMSVTIDGSCLTNSLTGTQLVTLGLLAALDRHTRLPLRVLVPDRVGPEAERFFALRPHIELIRRPDVESGIQAADVVHRPYQVTAAEQLNVLRAIGRRLVITQLDNIALRNPGYFSDFAQWSAYRRLHYEVLGAADQVVFISRHGADDARGLALVPEERINFVPPAVDHSLLGIELAPAAPSGIESIGDQPFLLCLGTDFLHKNRVFAIRLLGALRDVGAFDGMLVFAGPKVAGGSSGDEEAAYLSRIPDLASRVIDIGRVDEGGKLWLLERAAAVVYPSTYEGFGLTPFEAADVGTPCLFAAHTSLAEVLPEADALLVQWDAGESAKRVAPVLCPGEAREQLVQSVRMAGARFTSLSVARALTTVYTKAMRSPNNRGLALTAELVHLRSQRERLETERERLQSELSAIYDDPLNRGLVGPYAVLPPELRRPVLAVATRPVLRKTATVLYRAGYALRHVRMNARDGGKA